MPLEKLRINVILTRCNERSIFNWFEILGVVLLALLFSDCKVSKKNCSIQI